MLHARPNRKSAPGVRRGRVQKQNRTALSPDVYVHDADHIVYQRQRPVRGYYHAVSVGDVKRFTSIIPDWPKLSEKLRAVILTPGDEWAFGMYDTAGVITLAAWPRDEMHYLPERKRWLLERLGLDSCTGSYAYLNPAQAKAFLLLGTFLHEVGHHLDRMTTRTQRDSSNGEPYAIRYEQRKQRELWDAYVKEFGDPYGSPTTAIRSED